MINKLEQLNEQINNKSRQIDALRNAKALTQRKHNSAADMVQNCPQNIYIEDWKREEKHLAEVLGYLEQIEEQLSGELDTLCNDYEQEEKRQQSNADFFNNIKARERAELEEQERNYKELKERAAKGGEVLGFVWVTIVESNDQSEPKKIYFQGVDGYINTDPNYCDLYKRKGQLLNIIKKHVRQFGAMFDNQQINETTYKNSRWTTSAEVLAIIK